MTKFSWMLALAAIAVAAHGADAPPAPKAPADSPFTSDPKRMLRVSGATANNLKNVTAEFPLGLMTCVTGVSG